MTYNIKPQQKSRESCLRMTLTAWRVIDD